MTDYFAKKRTAISKIIDETLDKIDKLVKGNKTRSKKEIINNVEEVKKLLNKVDVKFKTDFMKMYNGAKEMKISISSGSANRNDPSKLIYHWTEVQLTGNRFVSTHRLPKVSEMGDILKQLADLIEANKNTKESVARAAKTQKNAETEKTELNNLRTVLINSRGRLGNNTNTRRSNVQGMELVSLPPALTQNQRVSIRTRFKNSMSRGNGVNTTRINKVIKKKILTNGIVTNGQLRSIARVMGYNINGTTT